MPDDLRDLAAAARFTTRFTSMGPLDRSYLLDALPEEFAALIAEAEPLIAEETGFYPPTPASARVMSRVEWAAANVDSMLVLVGPLVRGVRKRLESAPGGQLMKLAYGPALGAQLGTVLGLLSQRVLGQYDVLLGRGDEVMFVGVNILLMERRLGFVPRDFRMWVTLHELTHRAQFEGNPWVRDHFLSKAQELVDSLQIDARSLLSRAKHVVDSDADLPFAIRLMNPAQKQVFDDLQAFMTVIEGHGNFVMDRIAERIIPTQPRMRQVFRGGAPSGIVHKLLGKVLGLELKKAQYEQGQAFFDAISEAAGPQAPMKVFTSSEHLPTMQEIKAPELWISRVFANTA